MCSLEGCTRPLSSRGNRFGYCQMHLTRHYRYGGKVGDPQPRILLLGKPSLHTLLQTVESNSLDPKDCWVWSSRLGSGGYGVWGRDRAHRISYRLFNNLDVIPPGQVVMHSCDNPPCVNPKHLSLGTIQDNTRDMIAKGRQKGAIGSRNSNSKLSESDIPEIRNRSRAGESQQSIATDYNVSQPMIGYIVRGEAWTHA